MQSCMTHRRAPRAGPHAVDVVARSRAVKGSSPLIGKKEASYVPLTAEPPFNPACPSRRIACLSVDLRRVTRSTSKGI